MSVNFNKMARILEQANLRDWALAGSVGMTVVPHLKPMKVPDGCTANRDGGYSCIEYIEKIRERPAPRRPSIPQPTSSVPSTVALNIAFHYSQPPSGAVVIIEGGDMITSHAHPSPIADPLGALLSYLPKMPDGVSVGITTLTTHPKPQ